MRLSPMRPKLFVYGTLKRGLANHHFLHQATYLGQAHTLDPYPLIAPKRIYPYLIDAPGEGHLVRGELYQIDLATLKQIDRLEEYPTYYTRKLIPILDSQGDLHEAWTYFLARPIPYRRFPFLKEFPPKQEGG
ncbi:MAG: gamma-glutamylcyclotransferase [Nitratiruptor sp.]|nr:gamma-glutamylcyclotransferase [Nitratiruptor sp.]NPA82873.1 gamma-glutamylcyclotransferase [Campylobacterota bacterium]